MNRSSLLSPILILICIWPPTAFSQPAHDEKTTENDRPRVEVKISDVSAPGTDQALKVVEFEAASVGRTMKYMVLLPEGYETSKGSYPALYLLHGLFQNYTIWSAMGVPDYVKRYSLIVVMPDAGNSWYVNWSESPEGELDNWEDLIVNDIIPSVDRIFRTVPSREGRAINGLSMGGYGAMTIGLRHPMMFSSIGSHSGALGYARNARRYLETGEGPGPNVVPPQIADDRDAQVSGLLRIPGFTTQQERHPKGTAFATLEECDAHDPFFLIRTVPPQRLPHIYLDCGLDDRLLRVTQEFASLLLVNGIPFTYGQTPGDHHPSYWAREMAQSIAVQYAILERNTGAWEYHQSINEAAAEAEAQLEELQQETPNGP